MPIELQNQAASTTGAVGNLLVELEKLAEQNAQLSTELLKLKERCAEAERLNAWFRQQLFGKKSEKYLGLDSAIKAQLVLLELGTAPVCQSPDAAEKPAVDASTPANPVKPEQHKKKQRGMKIRPEWTVTGEGLRFGPDVPVEERVITDSAIEGLPAGEWERIGFETTHKLGQRKNYFVIKLLRSKYAVCRNAQTPDAQDSAPAEQAEPNHTQALVHEQPSDQPKQEQVAELPVVAAAAKPEYEKLPVIATTSELPALGERVVITAPLPAAVLPNCIADVSFLVGLLIDKFVYHLPLHRTYLRLKESGIEISRTNLTNWIHETGDLLYPVWGALCKFVLRALVITMDETPVRTRMEDSGQMKDGWLWGVYGEQEFFFYFATSREYRWIAELLGNYKGTLLADGFGGYKTHCDSIEGLILAACWSHARRAFAKADDAEPKLTAEAAGYFRDLYRFEQEIRDKKLVGQAKLDYRIKHSKPVVENFLSWCDRQEKDLALLPKNPLTKAVAYARNRREELCVYLTNPDVPIDTNHLERQNKQKAIGQHNWLFNSTEEGAKHMATFYSLIGSCKLNGVDPREYLTDVLLRLVNVPGTNFNDLIPRVWKEKFSKAALKAQAATPANSKLAA